jgi:hypothetical protein
MVFAFTIEDTIRGRAARGAKQTSNESNAGVAGRFACGYGLAEIRRRISSLR